ncbi:pentapeptide repeat-containing protein [Streptomyces microflavus]|uniref:pentapeptide repeat-containing protein n=1 Tax=Streptomyces microflavus TaxID=1919 RepID=UPI00380802DD
MTNPFQRRANQDGRHTPNLWPVWLVAPGALLLVALGAYVLYHGAELLLASETTGKGKKPVPVQDVIKTTVTVLTLAGAVLAALYAYRKQLLDEGTSHRADATQLTERYTKAAEQLGHEQAAVRLAGVYAMARLADDWPEQRQVCIDVLCAYLRMPYDTDSNAAGFRHGEREVRLTIIRIIRSHLQDPTSATTWCGRSLDFSGATFDGGDFSGVTFSGVGVNFRGAEFSGGTVDFSYVTFDGGLVEFSGAKFSGGQVDFHRATLSSGAINFGLAELSSGQIRLVGMTLSGSQLSFHSVMVSGGRINFYKSTFCDGLVDFDGAMLSGGTVDFSDTTSAGNKVDFSNAMLSDGQVEFSGAEFSGGQVDFHSATFSGSRVDFNGAKFSGGQVDFDGAMFSGGQVDFHSATFSGSQVSFVSSQVRAAADIDWGPLPPVPVAQP